MGILILPYVWAETIDAAHFETPPKGSFFKSERKSNLSTPATPEIASKSEQPCLTPSKVAGLALPIYSKIKNCMHGLMEMGAISYRTKRYTA